MRRTGEREKWRKGDEVKGRNGERENGRNGERENGRNGDGDKKAVTLKRNRLFLLSSVNFE